jgi:hypothetical protein
MPWPRLRRHRSDPLPPAIPLSELDSDGLEVIEVGAAGLLAGPGPWSAHESPREVPYASGGRDPGSLAGIWEALGRP